LWSLFSSLVLVSRTYKSHSILLSRFSAFPLKPDLDASRRSIRRRALLAVRVPLLPLPPFVKRGGSSVSKEQEVKEEVDGQPKEIACSWRVCGLNTVCWDSTRFRARAITKSIRYRQRHYDFMSNVEQSRTRHRPNFSYIYFWVLCGLDR
jgi:hypothetical protein